MPDRGIRYRIVVIGAGQPFATFGDASVPGLCILYDMSANTDKSEAINFGKILKIEMAGTGDSTQSLANRADLHRSHISDICRGRKSPNLATVRKIADAFPASARDRIILYYAREVLCAQIADLVDISIKPQSAKSRYQLDGVDQEVTSSSLERYVRGYSNERVGA